MIFRFPIFQEEFYNVADVESSSVFSTDEGQKTYSYLAPTETVVSIDLVVFSIEEAV